MGRPRKTIEELKRSGTYRPSRHRDRDGGVKHGPCETHGGLTDVISHGIVNPTDTVTPPAELDAGGRVWWGRLTAALVGRITRSDVPQLARACGLLANADSCEAEAKKLSATTPEHGRATRAALANAAAADRILAGFGLTPAARAKLGVVESGMNDGGVIRW